MIAIEHNRTRPQVMFPASEALVAEAMRQLKELFHLKGILQKAGCTLVDVVNCDCTLQDARDFDGSNKVYATYFKKDPPVRTAAVAQHVRNERVEIGCIAYKQLKR